jgi:hypothetical protein
MGVHARMRIPSYLEKDLLIVQSKKQPNLYVVSGLGKTTYSFLQNIQRLKGELHKQCLTFKPVQRVSDQIVIMSIERKAGCKRQK